MNYEQPEPKEAAEPSEDDKKKARYKAIGEQVANEFKVGEDAIRGGRAKKLLIP